MVSETEGMGEKREKVVRIHFTPLVSNSPGWVKWFISVGSIMSFTMSLLWADICFIAIPSRLDRQTEDFR